MQGNVLTKVTEIETVEFNYDTFAKTTRMLKSGDTIFENLDPVDWFKRKWPMLEDVGIKANNIDYLGDGQFTVCVWRQGGKYLLQKPSNTKGCMSQTFKITMEVCQNNKDFNKGYWEKTYQHNPDLSDFSIESVKTPEELATEWSNATSQDEQLDAYNLAQIEFFQRRAYYYSKSVSKSFCNRTIAILNTAVEFAHRGVFRNRYAYAIAALVIYCDDIIPRITDKFPSLSEFLNAVQKNKRRDDEVAGTVCEWCDRIFVELDLAD